MKAAGILMAMAFCVSLRAQPLALHPDNPHYFLYRGKPTIIITSAEHYGAVLNLDFDYAKYLRQLEADGLNNTRTFTGAYVEPQGAFNIARNTLAPEPNRFIAPWARSETPGYANGGNKFDLTKWDEKYFARLKDFMAEADKRGVIVEMNLFCPFYEEKQWSLSPQNAINNVNGIGKVARTNVYTMDRHGGLLAVHEEMTRKIVTELNGFDNLYYEICNEPYFGGVTLEWQHHIAETIVATEKNLPKKHLISRNVANGSAKIDKTHPAVNVYNFHYASPPDTVALNYDLNRPIGDNETGFRGTNDLPYRVEAWAFLTAGGALYNNLDYSFVAGHEDGTFVYPASQPGGGNPKFREQLRTLRDFIYSFDFIQMKPAPEVIKGGLPPGARGYALGKAGDAYAIYIGPAPEIKDQFSARWSGEIEPRFSEEYTLHTLSNDGVRLWVDGKLIIDNWTGHSATEDAGKIKLEAGKRYPIKLEYFQSGGNSVMKLFWSSASQRREVVPQSVLYLPKGGPGLEGEYFETMDLKEKRMTRADLTINFDWSQSSPFAKRGAVSADRRSVELELALPDGSYGVEWVDPVSGRKTDGGTVRAAGGVAKVRSPEYQEDLALAVRKR
jgi:hypothetical protein